MLALHQFEARASKMVEVLVYQKQRKRLFFWAASDGVTTDGGEVSIPKASSSGCFTSVREIRRLRAILQGFNKGKDSQL
jgi:hypothetical protein